MMKINRTSIRPYLLIGLGCMVMTMAMNIFLIPFKLAPGGVSGLATVIYYIIDGVIPVGTLMLIFNIPLFLTGYKSRGRSFLMRSLFGTVALSVFIDLTAPFTEKLVTDYLIRLMKAWQSPIFFLMASSAG
jgi:uncharacterized membrane-anchored protein YitT (DUF2179 family)